MEESIIIYTKYFSEAVIEVIDQYDLNIQLLCFSSYDKVLDALKTTPNLRGIIFLEYKPKRSIFKAYKSILETADEICEASKQPFCVSIISNTDLPRKFVNQINTSYIEVLFTKYMMFNTDLLKFEGIASVIVHTIGVANNTILLEMQKNDSSLRSTTNSRKIEFLRYCLQIATVPKEELDSYRDAVSVYPELEKLIYLRNYSDWDKDILDNTDSLVKVFSLQCIARREEDEKDISFVS